MDNQKILSITFFALIAIGMLSFFLIQSPGGLSSLCVFSPLLILGVFILLAVYVLKGGLPHLDWLTGGKAKMFKTLQEQIGGQLKPDAGVFSHLFEQQYIGDSLSGQYSGLNFWVEEEVVRHGRHHGRNTESRIVASIQYAKSQQELSFSRIDGLGDKVGSKIASVTGTETIGNVMMNASDKNAGKMFLMNWKPQIDRLLSLSEPIGYRSGRLYARMRYEFKNDAAKVKEALELLVQLAK
jgi:hypothetical protein